jgi:cyclopropane fatty-acyl-phospholipid synthase-like methyltransferase
MKSLFYEIIYRYFRAPWESGPREELVKLVESKHIAPCRTIDLGCGTGANAIFLAQYGFDVTGVDFSTSAVEKARTKAKTVGVVVNFVVDNLTMLQHVTRTFDFLVDYGTFDDLSPKDREKYIQNVLPLANQGSLFLLWCFEWKLRWWELFLLRLLPFGRLALEPGEVQTYFGERFEIERISGTANLQGWPRGYACYLMTRRD